MSLPSNGFSSDHWALSVSVSSRADTGSKGLTLYFATEEGQISVNCSQDRLIACVNSQRTPTC